MVSATMRLDPAYADPFGPGLMTERSFRVGMDGDEVVLRELVVRLAMRRIADGRTYLVAEQVLVTPTAVLSQCRLSRAGGAATMLG
jgi:hypothetical protein